MDRPLPFSFRNSFHFFTFHFIVIVIFHTAIIYSSHDFNFFFSFHFHARHSLLFVIAFSFPLGSIPRPSIIDHHHHL